MAALPLIVFDVNETLLDLTTMEPTFERIFRDKSAMRLAKISATLFREVSFGWGILGHLDKGGNFVVEQADVGDGAWEITHIQLNFTGKIMMVKSLMIKSDEHFSDFRRVPDNLTFAQGVDLLKQEWGKLQHGDTGTATANRKPR